jgi:hypothetical protein
MTNAEATTTATVAEQGVARRAVKPKNGPEPIAGQRKAEGNHAETI